MSAIAWVCWSFLAWSWTLLILTESAPAIHLSLKLFLPQILSTNSVQALHFSWATTFFPRSLSLEQSSHDKVWYSRSRSRCHFLKVAYLTHRFFTAARFLRLTPPFHGEDTRPLELTTATITKSWKTGTDELIPSKPRVIFRPSSFPCSLGTRQTMTV